MRLRRRFTTRQDGALALAAAEGIPRALKSVSVAHQLAALEEAV